MFNFNETLAPLLSAIVNFDFSKISNLFLSLVNSDYGKIIIIFLATIIFSCLFKEQRKIIFGAGIYHSSAWFFDNPVWISAEIKWGIYGVSGMVLAAALINISLFVFFRNKEAKFTLWNFFIDKLLEKDEEYIIRFREWTEKKRKKDLLGAVLGFIIVVASWVPAKLFFLLVKVLKVSFWGDAVALVVLSIIQDPFIAVTYIRHGNIDKLTMGVIAAFLVSLIISLGYWSIRNGLIAELVIRPLMF